ncbi:MAG: hypothetical protein DMG78_07895 [Acidobacteria bacterium]|nr:MAG: hypothetical protein DMG78_07895 [Acidobacteriota bacterium]
MLTAQVRERKIGSCRERILEVEGTTVGLDRGRGGRLHDLSVAHFAQTQGQHRPARSRNYRGITSLLRRLQSLQTRLQLSTKSEHSRATGAICRRGNCRAALLLSKSWWCEKDTKKNQVQDCRHRRLQGAS